MRGVQGRIQSSYAPATSEQIATTNESKKKIIEDEKMESKQHHKI